MYYVMKRLIDIVGALFLSIGFLPIALLTAIAIKLDSNGPILADTPDRVGQGGKLFKFYKFRSMIVNAHDLLRKDPHLKRLFEKYKKNSYKLVADPRVTRVGKFIRKHSIDELPQLLNVLKGEMSLVGPRPYYSDELIEQQKKYPHTKDLVEIVLSAKGFWKK